ncbi:MAG: error-prone DNA polymerase [Proteobacteria bacterium]|nr:error-prone DNA polymerase [Pseudomonadota bacterium]
MVPPSPLFPRPRIAEALPLLPSPTVAEAVVADYRTLGLSLRAHPIALLRRQLRAAGWLSCAELKKLPNGAPAAVAGLVITRQRPNSASGVVFVTLEDESEHSNVIIWPQLVERQRREVLEARLLGVRGRVQREGEVLHLIATHLEDHSELLGSLLTRSRDFH